VGALPFRSETVKGIRRSRSMVRKIILMLMVLGLLLMSGCATDSYTSSSSDYSPNYSYSYKEMCGYGAVYCGPGP
jgi:hypothetical protein